MLIVRHKHSVPGEGGMKNKWLSQVSCSSSSVWSSGDRKILIGQSRPTDVNVRKEHYQTTMATISLLELIWNTLSIFAPHIKDLKKEWKECIAALLEETALLGLLPAGFGKSLIYQHYPENVQLVKGKTGCHVLVISVFQRWNCKQHYLVCLMILFRHSLKCHGLKCIAFYFIYFHTLRECQKRLRIRNIWTNNSYSE